MKKFIIEMDVRDNELDAQQIVNNSNYMIYLSHARHKHVDSIGLNFDDYLKNNQKLVLLSCTLKYVNSLVANDSFVVSSTICKGELPYQWCYKQDIKRKNDSKVILKASFLSTCINGNLEGDEKLYIPDLIKNILE